MVNKKYLKNIKSLLMCHSITQYKPIIISYIDRLVWFPLVILLTISLVYGCASTQTPTETSPIYEIQYTISYNGETSTKPSYLVWADRKNNFILNNTIREQKSTYPFEITKVEKPSNTIVSYAFLEPREIIASSDKKSVKKQTFELTNETKEILGYNCKKAVTIVNSNTIEVWYTNDLNMTGGPTELGQNLGLVLEIERNKNFLITASSIDKVEKTDIGNILNGSIQFTDPLSYADLLWKSRFTTLKVFENATINNFTDESKSTEDIKRFAGGAIGGTIILKKVKFPVITEGDTVFIEVKQHSNGDAYDRIGTVFFIPQDKEFSFFNVLEKDTKALASYDKGNTKQAYGVTATENYSPAVEMMRFITTFGIQKFNHIQLKGKDWQTISQYRQEITELKPALSGKEIWIGANIGNYDKGGHKVSLEITIHKSQQTVYQNNTIISLFNTLNLREGQDYSAIFSEGKSLFAEFTLKKDLKDAQLRYITTGHGGWGNGDEFVPKANSILLDGKMTFSFVPWRSDCGSYRLYNPASGNFKSGLSSSDLSRSNWCPGTVTIPNFIPLGDLKAGKHTIQVKIPQGAPEGSSSSAWSVSGVLLGSQ